MVNSTCPLLITLFSCLTPPLLAQEISRSFELRYFSSAPEANGETDFKGPTAGPDVSVDHRHLSAQVESLAAGH